MSANDMSRFLIKSKGKMNALSGYCHKNPSTHDLSPLHPLAANGESEDAADPVVFPDSPWVMRRILTEIGPPRVVVPELFIGDVLQYNPIL